MFKTPTYVGAIYFDFAVLRTVFTRLDEAKLLMQPCNLDFHIEPTTDNDIKNKLQFIEAAVHTQLNNLNLSVKDLKIDKQIAYGLPSRESLVIFESVNPLMAEVALSEMNVVLQDMVNDAYKVFWNDLNKRKELFAEHEKMCTGKHKELLNMVSDITQAFDEALQELHDEEVAAKIAVTSPKGKIQ